MKDKIKTEIKNNMIIHKLLYELYTKDKNKKEYVVIYNNEIFTFVNEKIV